MDFHALLSEPLTWVVITFVLFIGGVFKIVKKLLFKVLDERSAKIDAELKQAQALREEAEAVLALYKQKQAEYTKEAQAILAKAREDADMLATHADRELKAVLDTRMQSALDEIAQEEARAITDVRAHVVDIAMAAARNIVLQHIKATPQKELLNLALSDIERKVH